MNKTKQVIVVRKDLGMRRGKSEAQVAHASMKVFFDRMEKDDYPTPRAYKQYKFSYTDAMEEWIEGSFTKVVVSCDSEEELLDLQKHAEEAGIVNALIQDSGQTEFKEECPNCEGNGEFQLDTWGLPIIKCKQCNGTGKINKPTYTTLAIGPDYSDKINKVTGDLKLR